MGDCAEESPNKKIKQDPIDWDSLSFAHVATDSMYLAVNKEGESWKAGKIVPFGNVSMSPCAGVLNYGQGCFEGMKAQRTKEGKIVIFRPDRNADRFSLGAKRLGMSPVPEDIFVEAVHSVVKANARWVPPHGKGGLYIRPCLWNTAATLPPSVAPETTFIIYVSPVGPYFKGGLKPISLQVAGEFHRAAPGGQGHVKANGNYAAGIIPANLAKKDGYNEVIYLDAVNHRYIEEVGTANFFCVKGNTIHTPKLAGTILAGITRMSVIQIARDFGYEVLEELVDIDFALTADEAFCTGTAAIIAPIGKIKHGDKTKEYCGMEVGPVTRKLYDTLVGIQLGLQEDKHKWVVEVSS